MIFFNKLEKFKRQMSNALRKQTGIQSDYPWRWILEWDDKIEACQRKNLSPEESVLSVVQYVFGNLEQRNVRDAQNRFTFFPAGSDRDFKPTANVWVDLAGTWNKSFKVGDEQYAQFIENMNATKHRWPILFSGEKTGLAEVWEVYYDQHPTGLATQASCNESIADFTTFAEAVSYVLNESDEQYWWHTFDLALLAKTKKVPLWEKNTPPKSFVRIDEKGRIGYSGPPECTASDCIFAMPYETYSQWKFAVEQGERLYKTIPDPIDSNDPNLFRLDFVSTWTLRKVITDTYS